MINIAGKRFGYLVAVTPVGQDAGGNWRWNCICDCGKQTVVKYTSLFRGTTKSCGCLAKELLSKRATTHGMSNTPTYRSWMSMKRRCNDSSNDSYPNYGGRGIKYSLHWEKFDNFLADMGVRPKGTTLDRIDTDGNYTPENCRWADDLTQHRNTRANVMITSRGVTQTLAEWADQLGIRRSTLQKRIANGWSIAAALGTF